MPVRAVIADERIKDDQGRLAVQRGPVIFCAEWPDNVNSGVLDLMIYGTAHSRDLPNYGGGHLFRDLVEKKTASVEVETDDGRSILAEVGLDEDEEAESPEVTHEGPSADPEGRGKDDSEKLDQYLLRRYHLHGDRKAREQLITMYLPLVRSLARRYASRGEHLIGDKEPRRLFNYQPLFGPNVPAEYYPRRGNSGYYCERRWGDYYPDGGFDYN